MTRRADETPAQQNARSVARSLAAARARTPARRMTWLRCRTCGETGLTIGWRLRKRGRIEVFVCPLGHGNFYADHVEPGSGEAAGKQGDG